MEVLQIMTMALALLSAACYSTALETEVPPHHGFIKAANWLQLFAAAMGAVWILNLALDLLLSQ